MVTTKPTTPTMMAESVCDGGARQCVGWEVFLAEQWFLKETPDLLYTLTTAATVPNVIPIRRPHARSPTHGRPKCEYDEDGDDHRHGVPMVRSAKPRRS